ncbi:MAG: hypothetical protein ACRDF0_05005 [Candidatus Limnocylindria bacterium]
MSGTAWRYTLAGSFVFVGITAFEQLPLLGWLGALLSLGAWAVLTRELVAAQRRREGTRPAASAAAMGAITGFVGALTAWLAQAANLVGAATPAGDRFGAGLSAVGATLGLAYWPLVGALVCFGAALAFTRGARR